MLCNTTRHLHLYKSTRKKKTQNLNTPKSSQVRDHQTLLVLTGQPGKFHSFPHSLVNYLAPQLREEMTIIMKGLETSLPKPDSRRRQTNTKWTILFFSSCFSGGLTFKIARYLWARVMLFTSSENRKDKRESRWRTNVRTNTTLGS